MFEEVEKKKEWTDEIKQTSNEIAYIELCVHVGLLFNDLLLNSSDNIVGITKIHRDNIQQIDFDLEKICNYFFKGKLQQRSVSIRKMLTVALYLKKENRNLLSLIQKLLRTSESLFPLAFIIARKCCHCQVERSIFLIIFPHNHLTRVFLKCSFL